MTNYTPGPWTAEEKDKDGHVVVADVQGVSICRCYQQPYDTWRAIDTANLIAAAPDMLEALQGLLEYTGGSDSPFDHPIQVARRAVAKAAGHD